MIYRQNNYQEEQSNARPVFVESFCYDSNKVFSNTGVAGWFEKKTTVLLNSLSTMDEFYDKREFNF